MNIYVDFDDCLCETARYFSKLAEELFGIKIPYEKIKYFNLQKSFSLNEQDYNKLMIEGHREEVLLSYEETPGACKTINEWIEKGHQVKIITGRPASVYEVSRKWLNQHGLEKVNLFCLDKYGRENFIKGGTYNLTLDDFYKMPFDYAVEDSPLAFKFFTHLPNLKVMVFDRPWNKEAQLSENYTRCANWDEISRKVK